VAVNKNALIRFQILDKCFRNTGRRYSLNDLLEEVNNALFDANPDSTGIKRRQLFDDISFMESEKGWSIPLYREKEGRNVFYRYEDSKFSINNQPLNELETEQLSHAISIISRFKGLPQFEWINDILFKINHAVVNKSKENNIVGFDNNPYLKGLEFMGELFNAILYKKVLELTYQGFNQKKSEKYIFHPYFLKEYNKRWFVFGHCEEMEMLANFPLDRIIKFEQRNKLFEESDIDFDEYFEDIIGVTRPEREVEKIILNFVPEQIPYILSKPIHGSQKKVKEDATGLIISIEVIPNYELETLILSFGNKVKVIAPVEFKEIILKKLKEATDLYLHE